MLDVAIIINILFIDVHLMGAAMHNMLDIVQQLLPIAPNPLMNNSLDKLAGKK